MKSSGLRFEIGSKECGICKTKDNVIQFERAIKKKNLPIIEIAFLCESCADKRGLIKDSIELKGDE